jgi:hypothetical protein
MFCNVFNAIQRGSCVPEHNDVKSAKSNATPQIHVFTSCYWHVSMITMAIDVRLAMYIILFRMCWHHVM